MYNCAGVRLAERNFQLRKNGGLVDVLQSVEGICRNGKIELTEPVPAGADGRVIVTFLSAEVVDLSASGITLEQAANLRHRLSAFADDWNDPEMDSYDAI